MFKISNEKEIEIGGKLCKLKKYNELLEEAKKQKDSFINWIINNKDNLDFRKIEWELENVIESETAVSGFIADVNYIEGFKDGVSLYVGGEYNV